MERVPRRRCQIRHRSQILASRAGDGHLTVIILEGSKHGWNHGNSGGRGPLKHVLEGDNLGYLVGPDKEGVSIGGSTLTTDRSSGAAGGDLTSELVGTCGGRTLTTNISEAF